MVGPAILFTSAPFVLGYASHALRARRGAATWIALILSALEFVLVVALLVWAL